MKKLAVKPRRPKLKKSRANRRETGLRDVDLSVLRMLLASGQQGESLEDMIDEFLELRPEGLKDMPDAEAMSSLAGELERLRIDANGGDPEARETLAAARDKIGRAARRDEIHPSALVVLGRLFAGSQVDIGDAARALMGRYLEGGLFPEPGEESHRTLVKPLLRSFADDPFEAHEELRSLIAIFPLKYKVSLIEALAADTDAHAVQTGVGFLLDPEAPLALAAIRGLAASAARGTLDAQARRRIEMIRPWLAATLRDALDQAVPRAEAGAALTGGANIVRASASACDGSGASGLFLRIKRGSRFAFVSLMAKPQGLTECLLLDDLPEREVAAIEHSAGASTGVRVVPLAAWTKLLRLALGRNVTRGAPPPFALVQALETAGVDSLAPDIATTAEILDSALAGMAGEDDSAAVTEAHEAVVASDAADGWFEAGESVEAVLRTTESAEEGAQALLEGYLQGRRSFWAAQCALSSLALHDGSASGRRDGADFAVVGRDILQDTPLADIPLMRQIADRSAMVFFARS